MMKESVLDVLMYLFESYVESHDEPEPNRHELKQELGRAGFHDLEIERALDWLDGLNTSGAGNAPKNTAFRVFDVAEQERLDATSRGYLLQLEQIGILQPAQRELVIDRLAGARQRGDRRRADQVGRDDGAIQSTRPTGCIRADGGSRLRG